MLFTSIHTGFGPTEHLVEMVIGGSTPTILKLLRRQPDHSPPSTEVIKAWTYSPASPLSPNVLRTEIRQFRQSVLGARAPRRETDLNTAQERGQC